MSDKTDELINALFQLARDLRDIHTGGNNETELRERLRSAGSVLWDSLVTINGGRGPTGKSGGV